MHIFYPIASFYPAQSGGPNNSIYWQAKALLVEGHQVTVVSTDQDIPGNIPLNCWFDRNYGRVQYVRTRWFLAPLGHLLTSIGIVPKADVIHLTSLFYPVSLPIAALAVWFNKPVIWSPRGELDPQALIYRPRVKRLFLWFIRRLAPYISFHTTSKTETNYVRQHMGSAVRVVELPNYMELPVPMISQPDKYILFVGRLHPIKALDRLIEALARSVVFREQGWRLCIAGTGLADYINEVKQQAQQAGIATRIDWLGMIHGGQKEHLYANARLTVLPSHSENFGNVVVESLAQHTPVVASTGTPWQLLEQKQAGYWVSNEPAHLQKAIDSLLVMPEPDYQLYCQRAGELVRNQFDVYANVGRWITAYEQIGSPKLTHELCVE